MGAQAGEFVLLSQDEARFPMVPTLAGTLGVKGHRPVVGTWDNKGLLYVFAVVNTVTAAVHANTLESPRGQTRRTGLNKTRRLQQAFADHLRHVARHSPSARHGRVVLVIDNAPWPAGERVRQALADNPHLELYRLPSYSPCLNVLERLWRLRRRRATHNRLFDTLGDLKQSIRNSLRYFQTQRHRVTSLVHGCYREPEKQTPSTTL
ncbi:MAG: transposase [Gemmataceae bacterium]